MSYSYLLLGPPGSGKSTLARQALQVNGNGLIALAPGLDEEASYRQVKDLPSYKLRGFDDPEFYPSVSSWKATGYDELIGWLRGAYGVLKKAQDEGQAAPYTMLVTDTFNAMSTLAQNKTAMKLQMDSPPPAKSPDGSAYWGLQRQLQESIARACRVIKGMGVTWVATCHVAEKEQKEASVATSEGLAKMGMAPAISGGFRDVMTAAFDVVLYTGVMKDAAGKPVHYLQWMPDPRRPTKSRLGALAEQGKIAADWQKLQERIRAAEAA